MRDLVDYIVKKTIVEDMGYKFLETNILLQGFKRIEPYIVDIHALKENFFRSFNKAFNSLYARWCFY